MKDLTKPKPESVYETPHRSELENAWRYVMAG